MKINPTQDWHWSYDTKQDIFKLEQGSSDLNLPAIKLPFKAKNLVNDALTKNVFSVLDVAAFELFSQTILDNQLQSQFLESDIKQIILTCVAAKRFYKPVQPKSWFFDSNPKTFTPDEGDLILLSNEYNQGLFIVVDIVEEASLCVCITADNFQLNQHKTLKFKEVIKVMNNRLMPAPKQLEMSFAKAG